MIESRDVYKVLLKIIYYVILSGIVLGKYYYFASGFQSFDCFPDSGFQPCVVVYRNSVGVVEDEKRERGYDMTENPVKPAYAFGFFDQKSLYAYAATSLRCIISPAHHTSCKPGV